MSPTEPAGDAGPADPAPIDVRDLREDDVDAVVDLLGRALGPGPGGADRRDLFVWKHMRNPFGPSVALVAESGGRLVGVRTFLRWRFAVPGGHGQVAAVRAVDTATDPEVQRRGVFSSLTLLGLERCREEGIAFVFNTPNSKSLPGYLKMGWREVTRWPMLLRVRHPGRMAGAAIRRNLRSGDPVDPPADGLPPAADVLDRSGVREAVAASAPPSGLATPRSLEYLRWRYADGPLPYRALLEPGPAPALLVARIRARGSLTEAVVCEALGEPATLARLLRELPRAAGADHAVAHTGPGSPAFGAYRKAGYRRLPRAGMTFVVRRVDDVPLPEGAPDPLAAGSWSLSLGDLELF
ncbi:MAG TPA: GNAT family N-acetyltransferase [Actinomycetota bacterium]|nr:GNAT family N-acetyltransferase [Actinomycetota bacterium]